jgi:hypothetical protein
MSMSYKVGSFKRSTQHFTLNEGGGVYVEEAKNTPRIHLGRVGGDVGSMAARRVAEVDRTMVG